jgi:protein-L-isoaspartate(D-aspartate) O-methyltransferase
MTDYADARTRMVESQLRTEDVTDYGILRAMGEVPREVFVPEALKPLAYIDKDLLIRPASGSAAARYLMAPAPFARLLQAAEISPTDAVLDVGAGSGYGAAVLSRLAASVVAIESDETLAAGAVRTLRECGVANATVEEGPMEAGDTNGAPYDVIVLEGAVEFVPEALLAQLAEGGRLVAIVGYGRSAPATVYTKTDGDIGARKAFDARVPPLPGFEKPKAFVF